MSDERLQAIRDLTGAFHAATLVDDYALQRSLIDRIILGLGDEGDHWMTMSYLLDVVMAQRGSAAGEST